MARNLIIVSIFIFILVCQVNGRVVVSFKLKHYENPSHNELDGGCCDPGCGSCDNRFNICLDVYKGNNDLSDCAYGNFETKRLYENDDSFDFPASLNDDLTNPIIITVNSWSGGFRSKIDVWDKDNWWDRDDKIDYYGYNYGYTPQRTEALATTRTVTLNGAGTGLLQVEVKVYCSQHYYGTSSGCNTYCVARDNSGGHYDCDDITGRKVCHAGWTGSSCDEASNECDSDPCKNGAACTDLIADYRCDCPPGTEGKNCNDIDECASTPCEHDGTCTDYLNYFRCDCAQHYSGITCQFEVDYCDPQPCLNGATCLGLNDDDVLQCECAPGYEGDTCSVEINECANITCLNNGTCVDMIGSFACNCSEGYAGALCQSDIRDECASNPCQNNASCVDLVGRFVCVCVSGFVSENCEEDYNECDPNPCVFGNCTDLIDQYSCGCWAGYTGVNCTENIDECVHSQCQHNSTCLDGVNNYTCECLLGYAGLFCEDDVDECQSSPCQNGGMCDDSQMINNYTCDCSSTGYTGDRCELDVDECGNFVCPPDMLCVNLNGSYDCEQLATDSTPLPGVCRSNVCYNDGNCTIINNTYVCVCTMDFIGDLCETPTEPCNPNPCQNEGFCKVITAENGTLHYKCYCDFGYTGVNCTIGLYTAGSKEFTNWYIILVALLILIIIVLVLMFLYRSIRERRKEPASDPDTVFANPHIDSVSLPPFGGTAAPPLPPKGKFGQPDSSVSFCNNIYSDIDGVHGACALPEHPPPYEVDYHGVENPYAEGAYIKMGNGNATTPIEDGNDNHYEFAPDNVSPEVGPAVANEYSAEPSASASVREPFGIDNSYSTKIFPEKLDILPTIPQSPSSPHDPYSTTIQEMGAAHSNPFDHPRTPATPSSPKSTASFPDEYVPTSPPSPVTPNSPYLTSVLTDGASPEATIEGRSPTTPNSPYSTTIFSDAENGQSVM